MTVPSRTHPPEPAATASAPGDAHSALWVNDEPLPWAGLHISARDRDLTLADGVFETMGAHRDTMFRMDRHLTRLAHALRVLAIPESPELRNWVLAAVRGAGARDASVRLTVSRGIGAAGVAPPVDARPTVIVAVNPMPAFPAAVLRTPLGDYSTRSAPAPTRRSFSTLRRIAPRLRQATCSSGRGAPS